MYYLILDTNSYSGNFERNFCAFVTGEWGDSGVGAEVSKKYSANIQNLDWFKENSIHIEDPENPGSECYSPVDIYLSEAPNINKYNSVQIYIEDVPNDLVIAEIIDRSKYFVDNYHSVMSSIGRSDLNIDDFKLLSVRILKEDESLVHRFDFFDC